MLKTRAALIFALLALLAAVFVAGMQQLLRTRFSEGDVYPPYSSLRSDPLGSQALHDGLGEVRGIEVRRNYRRIEGQERQGGACIFVLGVPPLSLELDEVLKSAQPLAKAGNRVVIGLAPAAPRARRDGEANPIRKPKKPAAEKAKDTKAENQKDEPAKPVEAEDWGGVLSPMPKDAPLHALPVEAAADRVGGRVAWHGTVFFESLRSDWAPVLELEGRAVAIEREVGTGSIVVTSDSYWASNEGLWRERNPQWLAHVLGGQKRAVFDEWHLGVEEQSGVMTLARKYDLHFLLIALLLPAGLFVWRSMAPLVPRHAGAAGGEVVVQGRSAVSGFTSLLRRSLDRQHLMAQCYSSWKASVAGGFVRASPEVVRSVGALVQAEMAKPPLVRRPLAAYARIHDRIHARERAFAVYRSDGGAPRPPDGGKFTESTPR